MEHDQNSLNSVHGVACEDALTAKVYKELRNIASRHLRKERRGHTLQTTALVNEAYVRMAGQDNEWQDKTHFIAVAAQVMRCVLVDYARARRTEKRGGGITPLPLDESLVISEDRLERLLELELAFERLESEDPRTVQVIVMRFFGGLELDEIAKELQLSSRTVRRDWMYGLAFLRSALTQYGNAEPRPAAS